MKYCFLTIEDFSMVGGATMAKCARICGSIVVFNEASLVAKADFAICSRVFESVVVSGSNSEFQKWISDGFFERFCFYI